MTKRNTKALFLSIYLCGILCGIITPIAWSGQIDEEERDALRGMGSMSGSSSAHALSFPSQGSTENLLHERNRFSHQGEGLAYTPALLPESKELEDILDALGVTREDIERERIKYKSLEEIWGVEGRRFRSALRWVNVDGLAVLLEWAVLRRADTLANEKGMHMYDESGEKDIEWIPLKEVGGGENPLGGNGLEERLLVKKEEKKESSCCEPVWMKGGSVALRGDKAYRKMTGWDAAREGVAFVVLRGLNLGILALLGYDSVKAIRDLGVNGGVLVNIFQGQDEAAINRILGFLQNPAGPYLASTSVALPFIWGGVKGIWAGRQREILTIEEQEEVIEYLKTYPEGKWRDVFRWILPFHPLDNRVNTLLRHALWDGYLGTADLLRIEGALERIATQRFGYTQIVGMHALAKMVYANHLKDYERLKGEGGYSERFRRRVLGEIVLKGRGLEVLKELAQTKERWRRREGFWDGTDRVWKSVYANYLLWTLGQNKSWVFGTTMLGWKAGKAVLLSLFFKTFIEALIEYIRCPHAFKNLHYGALGPVNNRIECFENYIKTFNTIPGQPISTLTELVPHVSFPSPYDLSLANRRVRGYQVANLLTAIHTYNPGLYLRTLNLTGNVMQTPQDFEILLPVIGAFRSLEILDLSNAEIEIGFQGTNATLAFAQGMSHLSTLKVLDLSQNKLGFTGTAGVEAIGNGLQYLPHLTLLDLSQNRVGQRGTEGTEAIGQGLQYLPDLTLLDLHDNWIGFTGTEGIEAIGQGLQYLPHLMSLNLSQNKLGFTGTPGVEALGHGLQYTPNLTSLDLYDNWIGFQGPAGVEALGQSLQNLPYLTCLNLRWNRIGLRNMRTTGTEGVEALGQGLQYTPNLTSLDLSQNWIGYTGTNGTQILVNQILKMSSLQALLGLQQFEPWPTSLMDPLRAFWNHRGSTDIYRLRTIDDIKNYLEALPSNTTSINLGDLLMNPSGEVLGTLMQQLGRFSHLTSLDLSQNWIGLWETAGVESIGNGLQYLSNLTSLDLSQNWIGTTGTNGTLALAKGIGSLPHLRNLILKQNANFAIHGLAGVQALFQNIPFGQLCTFSMVGVSEIPWTEGQKVVYKLNRKPIEEACYAQRCFGKTVAPVIPSPCDDKTGTTGTTSLSSVSSARSLLQYEELMPLLDKAETVSPEPLEEEASAWTQRIHQNIQGLWQGTKDRVNGLTDWMLEKVIRYVHEVTHDNESYFPNIDDPEQRYWGETSIVNTTFSRANSTIPSVAGGPTGARPLN